MKILFTGASSFTGYWFVQELASAGHEVFAVFRRSLEAYEGVRGLRVQGLAEAVRTVPEVCFGDAAFLRLIEAEQGWDVLCHHAARVVDYKSLDFDALAAARSNTENLPAVLAGLQAKGCRRVVLTGSVFENDEGAGSEGLRAFSPYGLSKAITAQLFRFHVLRCGMHLGKFVISNPFGPYEEPRFTAYLMRCWRRGEVAHVYSPLYVRDNIHVSLLARDYRRFVESLPGEEGFSKRSPSGYVESQGAFAARFGREMKRRLGFDCQLELAVQTEFSEPRVRINTDQVDAVELQWDEVAAWDDLARYYQNEGQDS